MNRLPVHPLDVPDQLVSTATDAVVAEWALFRSPKTGGTELVRSEYEEVIRTAVHAVLRALPKNVSPPAQMTETHREVWEACINAMIRETRVWPRPA